jgi:hypothetical protein
MNRGVLCPECGGPYTEVRNSNHDTEGNKIRYRNCLECGHWFSTAEVVVKGFSFHRAKATSSKTLRTTREYIKVSTTPTSTVLTVHAAEPINRCRRGHDFTPENTYVQPKRGGRACRICMRAAALRRYHNARRKAPPSILEDQRRYWREQKRRQAA